MLNSVYNQLTTPEKELVHQKLAQSIQTHRKIIITVLTQMNPIVEVEGQKIVLYKNTLARIEKKVRQLE